jgi:cytochrome b6-f complex iron-sulfur subunit
MEPLDAHPVDRTVSGRRQFVNWLLGGSAAALLASIVYPVLRFLSPPQLPEAATHQIEAGAVNDPEWSARGFKIVRFGAEPVILIKAGENDFRAFSATCTHLDCIVGYSKDTSRMVCNYHGGQYDLTGRNVAGPPPRPLTVFKVNLASKRGGEPATIVISKA